MLEYILVFINVRSNTLKDVVFSDLRRDRLKCNRVRNLGIFRSSKVLRVLIRPGSIFYGARRSPEEEAEEEARFAWDWFTCFN